MIKQNFNFVRGDTYSRGITLENFTLEIRDIYFTVKEKSSDRNYVLQKRFNKGIVVDPDNSNRYILTIDADDTNSMKTNYNYVFDIEIITDVMKRTIVGGNLRLEDWDITTKANEV